MTTPDISAPDGFTQDEKISSSVSILNNVNYFLKKSKKKCNLFYVKGCEIIAGQSFFYRLFFTDVYIQSNLVISRFYYCNFKILQL